MTMTKTMTKNKIQNQSLTAIWRIFFHPAKFDNFKGEKINFRL